MHAVGDDVWTPAAVRYVKVLACQELWRALEGVLSGREIGDVIANDAGVEEDAYESAETPETTEGIGAGGNGVDAAEEHDNEPDEEEHNNAEAEEQDVQAAQDSESDEEKAHTNGDRHKKMIGLDWAIQLLFDALYLDEALQRKGSTSRNSGISSLAGKMEATVGIRVGAPFFDHDPIADKAICSSGSTRNCEDAWKAARGNTGRELVCCLACFRELGVDFCHCRLCA